MTKKEGYPFLLGRDPDKVAQKTPQDDSKVIEGPGGDPEEEKQADKYPMLIKKINPPGGVEPKYPILASTWPKPGELNPSFSKN